MQLYALNTAMEDANGCVPNVGDHTPIVVDLLSVYENQYNCTSRNARQPIRALIFIHFVNRFFVDVC